MDEKIETSIPSLIRGPLPTDYIYTTIINEDIFWKKTRYKQMEINMVNYKKYIFSERELTFTFAICRRPSVCRLSVVCL